MSKNIQVRLNLEVLEERDTPAATGIAWVLGDSLTFSFAPDGTDIGGDPSSLISKLDAVMGRSAWETEILRAFQSWAVNADLNIGLVADNGVAFGTPGAIQGSDAHGDIRIGARPLSENEAAVANPYDMLNTWSGSTIFDSTKSFSLGGADGAYDLYSVALHEAGHIFGLDHDDNQSAVMFESYLGQRAGLSPGDIAKLQALYGVRHGDRFEGADGNGALATAASLSFLTSASEFEEFDGTAGLVPYVANGDITTSSDVDYYRVTTPEDAESFQVVFRTSGLSLLTATVSVLDDEGNVVAMAAATDPRGGDLTLNVASADGGADYFVRVEANTSTVFGVGRYMLAVGGTDSTSVVYADKYASLLGTDGGLNDAAASATFLGYAAPSSGTPWMFTRQGSIETPTDVDLYRVQTVANTPGTMVVTVWALPNGDLNPRLQVLDANLNLVPVRLVSSDSNSFTIELQAVAANTDYFIRVDGGGATAGNYQLAVDFRESLFVMRTLASGTLSEANQQHAYSMSVRNSGLVRFDLSGSSTGSTVPVAVRMVIYDLAGNVVASMTAVAGSTASLDVFLDAGAYTVGIAAGTRDDASVVPNFDYRLNALVRTIPLGPPPIDPTTDPPQETPPPPPPPPPPDIVLDPVPTTILPPIGIIVF